MTLMLTGQRVAFKPKKGKIREGQIASAARAKTGYRMVLLDGDPFSIPLPLKQLSPILSKEEKTREYMRKWSANKRREDREWAQKRDHTVKLRKYGLTPEDYEELLEWQHGVCAICGLPETAKLNGKVRRLCVDHNHETKEVRGLLCVNCNKAVGHLKDDDANAVAVTRYLQGGLPRRTDVWGGDKPKLSACENVPNVVSSKEKVPKSGPSNRREEISMTDTATKPSAKKLRKEAQALGIKGWEDMDRKEMARAIKKASKASTNGKTASEPVVTKATKLKTKKAKAKKTEVSEKPVKKTAKVTSTKGADEALGLTFCKNAPKPLPPEGENPFRRKSNMFKIAKLLLKGGTRRNLAQKLAASAEIHPYHKADAEIDLLDYDKRLLLGAQTMRDKFGYGIQRQGRSIDGKILVFRPGGPNDPRKKGKK